MNKALTSTKISWFSVTVPPSKFCNWRLWKTFFSFKLPIFRHLNSIRCKHTAVGINVIIYYRHRTTTKTEVFPSVRIFQRTLELTLLKHSFLSKYQFMISHEHNNSFNFNFIFKLQTKASTLLYREAPFEFSKFDYSKAYMFDLQMLHEWNLEFRVISLMATCNHKRQAVHLSFVAFTTCKGTNKQKSQSFFCNLGI